LNGDFRPIANDSICNTGSLELAKVHPTYNPNHFEIADNKPDMGAYEANCENYWIPGYQYSHASTPIPYNEGVEVQENADLMWLIGREAIKSHVYFGMSQQKVEKANQKSKSYQGVFDSNIYTPLKLEKDKTYYWRVDTQTDKGIIKGDVWKFTVES